MTKEDYWLVAVYGAAIVFALGVWFGIHFMDTEICPLRATPEVAP